MTQPVHRFVYRAQCYPGQEEATVRAWRSRLEALRALQESGQLLTASVFGWGLHFFVYYEATDGSLTPDDLAGEMGGLLEIWPGGAAGRRFVPMMDIFHCGEPRSADYWRRKAPVESVRARLTRLQPEMVSSYIFYHYQLQEEKPGNFDKYCLISLHENLLFFYLPNSLHCDIQHTAAPIPLPLPLSFIISKPNSALPEVGLVTMDY